MSDDPTGQRDLRDWCHDRCAALQQNEGDAAVEDYAVRMSRSIVLEEVIEVPAHLVIEF
jgi:hypothetical protein